MSPTRSGYLVPLLSAGSPVPEVTDPAPSRMVWDDRDSDGVLDDHCATEAEDGDGFEDGDGCPDLDDDRDGVPDVRDACPRQADDDELDGAYDGCPAGVTPAVPDQDHDGVPDATDLCPHGPEDGDDGDGCPRAPGR